jgi:uncharacterized RDD family membrane protein YckC
MHRRALAALVVLVGMSLQFVWVAPGLALGAVLWVLLGVHPLNVALCPMMVTMAAMEWVVEGYWYGISWQ